jgi:hypothetical protein
MTSARRSRDSARVRRFAEEAAIAAWTETTRAPLTGAAVRVRDDRRGGGLRRDEIRQAR